MHPAARPCPGARDAPGRSRGDEGTFREGARTDTVMVRRSRSGGTLRAADARQPPREGAARLGGTTRRKRESRAMNKLSVTLPGGIRLTAEGTLAVTLATVLVGALILI